MTIDAGGRRRVPLGHVLNFRDLGGYATARGGTTRWGAVYRSDSLHKLRTPQYEAYEAVGIRSVIDLRSADERRERPGLASALHVPFTTSLPGSDPTTLRTRTDGERRLRDEYLFMLEHAAADVAAVLARVAMPEERPVVFHCAGGKDRTGLLAALLLLWLGVDREDVLDDYELTSHYVPSESLQSVVEEICATGVATEAAEGLLSTPRWAMRDALDELDGRYGGIESYLDAQAHVPAVTRDALREQLVVLEPR